MHEAEMIILFEDKPKPRLPDHGEEPGRSAFTSLEAAEAVAAIDEGRLTDDEACKRYGISADALAIWKRALKSFGIGRRRRHHPTSKS